MEKVYNTNLTENSVAYAKSPSNFQNFLKFFQALKFFPAIWGKILEGKNFVKFGCYTQVSGARDYGKIIISPELMFIMMNWKSFRGRRWFVLMTVIGIVVIGSWIFFYQENLKSTYTEKYHEPDPTKNKVAVVVGKGGI